jgi:integrase
MPRRAKNGVRLWFRSLTSSYVLIWTDETGTQRQEDLGHGDKRKAVRQQAEKEAQLKCDATAPVVSMRLSELLVDYRERTRGQVAEATQYLTDSAVRRLIKAVGDLDITRIRYQHGERLLQAILDAKLSPATANQCLRHLKAFFTRAVRRGQLEVNPLKDVKQLREEDPEVRVLEDKDAIKLLEAAKHRPSRSDFEIYAFILAALTTSLRRGALLNLTWPEVDFEAQVIRPRDKADTDVTWFWRSKRKTRPQAVPMTDELARELARIQAGQPEGHPYVFVPPGRYAWILKQRKRGKWTVRQGRSPVNGLGRKLDLLVKLAGLGHLTYHDQRRTCLTRWAESGLAEHETQALAGHSSITTTAKYYLHARDRSLDLARKASEKLTGGS